MTSGDHNLQDAELDDFIAGRDDLSRQLAALAQPEAPRQVNEAVMASIEAQLAQERIAKAAPAPVLDTVAPRPAANMARWRAPAALAASLAGVLLLTLEWQRGDYAQQAQTVPAALPARAHGASAPQAAPPQAVPPQSAPPQPAAQQPAPPQSAALRSAAPQAEPPMMPSPQPPAPPRSRPTAEATARPAPVPVEPINSAAPAVAGTLAMPAPMPAADAPLSYAPRPAPVVQAPPAPVALPAPVIAPAPAPMAASPVMSRSAASAHTMVSITGAARKATAQADTARAANWLHVIDEMLKAGLRNDAQEEWRKFRLAYPDYPVPEQLARQLDATD